MSEEVGDKERIATFKGNIGNIYLIINKFKESYDFTISAFNLAKEINSKSILKEQYLNLSTLYENSKISLPSVDDKIILNNELMRLKAIYYYKIYITYRDSIYNEETQKQSLQTSMQYEFDKKEIATKAEQEKKDAVVKEEKQKQKIVIGLVSCVLLLVVIFSFFLFNRFRITQKQKLIIEQQKTLVDDAYHSLHEKNKEVMDSINYAKRIQTALLPNEKYIHKNLKKSIKK